MDELGDRDPVRVLRIIGRMNVGGPAFLVIALMRGIDSGRIHQSLVSGEVLGNEKEVEFQNLGFEYTRLRFLSREVSLLSDLRALRAIVKVIRGFNPEIVDTHTFKAGLLGRIACLMFLNRKPIMIHHYHGHLLYGYFGKVKKTIYIQIEKVLSKFSDALVVDSAKIASQLMLEGIGNAQSYREILPGVSGPDKSTNPKRSRSDIYRIGFIGRFEPIKQPLHFLEVAREILHTDGKFLFRMIGEGSLSGLIEKNVRCENLDISISPFVPDIYSVLSEIDILIMTSLNEGTPLIIMEAAYCGVPTISYDVGSVDRVIQHGKTGLICGTSTAEISESIKTMTASEETYEEFSSNARRFAETSFSLERYSKAHEDLYLELLAIKSLQ